MKYSIRYCAIFAVFVAILAGMTAQAAPVDPVDYSPYPHFIEAHDMPGWNPTVFPYELFGQHYTGVVNPDLGLQLYRMETDAAVPLSLTQSPGLETDLFVQDWTAYVLASNGYLTLYSVALPETPHEVGQVNLSVDAVRIEVGSGHAFVAAGSGGLVIVDVTNPNSLLVVGGYGSNVGSLSVDGSRLALVNAGRAEILDISQPATPVLLGSIDPPTGYTFNEVILRGDVAYASGNGGTLHLDVSDPTTITHNPISVNTGRLRLLGNDLVINSFSTVVFCDYATGIETWRTRQFAGTRDIGLIAGSFVSAGNDRLNIFRDGVRGGVDPVASHDFNGVMRPQGIILDDILWGTNYSNQHYLVAAELGGDGSLLWELDLGLVGVEAVRNFAWSGSLIAVRTNTSRIHLVTTSRYGAEMRAQITIPELDNLNYFESLVFIDAETLVILNKSAQELRIINVSDPDQPLEVGVAPLETDSYETISHRGDRILVTNFSSYQLINASDHHNLLPWPRKVVTGLSHAICGADSVLYVTATEEFQNPAAGFERLETWDVTNPAAPFLIDSLKLASASVVKFAGTWGYQGATGLTFDLSDPRHPRPAGNFTPSVPAYVNRLLAGSEYLVMTSAVFSQNDVTVMASSSATGQIVSAVEDVPTAMTGIVVSAAPNPFNPLVTIRFNLPADSLTQIRIFDTRGRLVADLGHSMRQAGINQVTWMGKDSAGRSLPSGQYLARISTPGAVGRHKILLAK